MFVAQAVDVVTTDGQDYRFASGRKHPAADPSAAAQAMMTSSDSALSGPA